MRSFSTGGKGQKEPMSPKALFPGDVAKWPLSRHKSLLSPPASRTPAPLAPGRGSTSRNQSSPTWLGAVPAVPASSSPRILRGKEGGRQAIGAHRAGSSAARAYLAKSRATPEQLRVPAGSRGLFAHSRPESENTQQALPRSGERNSLGICWVITGHKALGVFAISVPQPTRQGWGWGEGRV